MAAVDDRGPGSRARELVDRIPGRPGLAALGLERAPGRYEVQRPVDPDPSAEARPEHGHGEHDGVDDRPREIRRKHRFDWDGPDWTGINWALLGIAAIFVVGGLLALDRADTMPQDRLVSIVEFELAGSGERLEQLLNGESPNGGDAADHPAWTERDIDRVRRQLAWDGVFIVGYALGLAVLCGIARRAFADDWAIGVGRFAGLGALVAGAADVVENGALALLTREISIGSIDPVTARGSVLAFVAALFAWLKFVLLAVAIVYLAIAVLTAMWTATEWFVRRFIIRSSTGPSGRRREESTAPTLDPLEWLEELDGAISWDMVELERQVAPLGPELDRLDARTRAAQQTLNDAQLRVTAARAAYEEARAEATSGVSRRPLGDVADLRDEVAVRSAELDEAARALATDRTARDAVESAVDDLNRRLGRLRERQERVRAFISRRPRAADDHRRFPQPVVPHGAAATSLELHELRGWYAEGLRTQRVPRPYADGRHYGSGERTTSSHRDWESASAELREHWRRMPARGRIGISCSGGGIRSASYHLGVYQALQEDELLRQSRYIASVSGGGYITGALTAARYESDPRLIADDRPFAPRSPEEVHLRNNTSYLAPSAMAKAKVGVRFVGGLLHNALFLVTAVWLVIAPLAAISRLSPLNPNLTTADALWWPLPLLVVGGLFAFVAYVLRPTGRFAARGWWTGRGERVGLRMIAILSAAAIGLSAVVIPVAVTAAPEWVGRVVQWLLPENLVGDDLSAGAGTDSGQTEVTFLGVLKLLGVFSVVGNAVGAVVSRNKAVLANIGGHILLPGAIIGAAWYAMTDPGADIRLWLAALVAMVVVFLPGDQNQRSFHPFYKRRLETVFLTKRVLRRRDQLGHEALPSDQYWSLSRYHETPDDRWPQTIFCAAANVTSEGLTPPGRDATAFTFSSTEIGGPWLGYVSTRHFEDVVSDRLHRNATLPAAVAISGAAFSPSMGKSTRPAFTGLLALLNMRLGVWTPHPDSVARVRRGNRDGWSRRPRGQYLLKEILRQHSVEDPFVYVTDGGHIDNLGLVELLRRGCTMVMAFDASGDDIDQFNMIGQAIALARTEVGVEIVIDPEQMMPDDDERRRSPRMFVTGALVYPDGTHGIIVFSKTSVVDQAPWDVRAFGLADDRFPAHSTLNQLFDDQLFESYRVLGYLTGAAAAKEFRKLAAKHHMRIGYVN